MGDNGGVVSSKETPIDDEREESRLWDLLPEKQGLERALVLIDLLWTRLGQEKFDYTIPLADEAIECAKQESNDQVLAQALTARGAALFNNGIFLESAEGHLAAALLFEKYDDSEATFGAYFHASWSMENAHEYQRGLELIDRAIVIAECEDMHDEAGASFMHRADLLEHLESEPSEILAAVLSARNAFKKAQNVICVLESTTRLAHLLTSTGENDRAIRLLRDARLIARSIDENREKYVAFLLGHALQRMGRDAEALAVLEECLEFARQKRNFPALASILWEMAVAAWSSDQVRARKLLEEARVHYDIVGNSQKLAAIEEKVFEWNYNHDSGAELPD